MVVRFKKPPKRGNKGKKNRKFGRNKVKCARYRLAHKREKSHVRRITKHLVKFPGDRCAIDALERWQVLA